MLILGDADVDRLADMRSAIAAVTAAMRAKPAGSLVAPARHKVGFGGTTELILGIGGVVSGQSVGGVRAYFSRGGVHFDDQVVAVWDLDSGRLKGVIVGSALGVLRMGAIGGVAMDALADPLADTVAIVGAGRQARSHLRAASCVRKLRKARVFSRSEDGRRAFAALMSRELDLEVVAEASVAAAVADASIVIAATTSLRPVLAASDLAPGAFVASVGYKSPIAKELDLDVADRASLIATDSPAQIAAFGRTFVLHGTSHAERIVDLTDYVSGRALTPPLGSGIRLCYPVGLTGTDVVVADDLFGRAEAG